MIGALSGTGDGLRPSARHPEACACSRPAGASKISAAWPLSRRLARRITATRSAKCLTMPRSWVISTIAMPKRFCRSSEQRRGSAPGWSRRAPSSARRRSACPARWRAPWRSSRAGAGRRTVRADSCRCGAGSGMPTSFEQFQHTLARLRLEACRRGDGRAARRSARPIR